MTYDNTNRGVLFKNNFRKSSSDAEYNGKINTAGTEHEIVAVRKISGPRSKVPNTPFLAVTFVKDTDQADDFDSPAMVGSGVLFKNDNKKSDKSPDYRGSLENEQGNWWLSAWIKESGAESRNPNMKFLSIACDHKDEVGSNGQTGGMSPTLVAKVQASKRAAQSGNKVPTPRPSDAFDDNNFDDIPF